MPLYPVKCLNCQHTFTAILPSRLRASLACEKCEHVRVEPDFSQVKIALDRLFAGSECVSLKEGVHPSEVAEARRLFPDHHWNDDGDLVYRGRADVKSFAKRKDQIRRMECDKKERAAERA